MQKSIWTILSGVVTISRSSWCVETKFQPCWAAFRLWQRVRKVMYTSNAVESINSSFRKVTKKGAFPNENALLKLLYLRTTELYKKWNGSKVQNWAMVRNQLATNEKISARIEKYEHMIWGINIIFMIFKKLTHFSWQSR